MEEQMFNCADDVVCYHDDEVTLPGKERTAMRGRRDANRKRVKDGLANGSKPKPREFVSQGSYAMKTMTQHPDNAYDVDDGVYFDAEALKGARGEEMSPLDVRNMIRDAVDDGSFKTKPEVRAKCVRVHYDDGSHVDIPTYRRKTKTNFSTGAEEEYFELAGAEWKRSDARDVTAWFDDQNTKQSPDQENGGQLRRITRLMKKFGTSRSSWHSRMAKGFTITALAVECFKPNSSREDQALYDTMKAIRDRLSWNKEVKHPVTPDEMLTTGSDDTKTSFLKAKLDEALEALQVLLRNDCTREQALKAWDKAFNTEYFSAREATEKARAAGAPAILSAGLLKSRSGAVVGEPVRKDGGGRYA
jgi:hypothetical protein